MRADLLVSSGLAGGGLLRFAGDDGSFQKVFVAGGSGGLRGPAGLTYGPDGYLYVISSLTDSVHRFSGITGAFVDTFVAPGSGGLKAPVGLAFSPDGALFVGSAGTDSILCYDGATGKFLRPYVSAGSGLGGPFGSLAFGPDGHLYVSSFFTNSVLRFDGHTGHPDGAFTTGGDLARPLGLAFGPDGHLYVASSATGAVLSYHGTTGEFLKALPTADGSPLAGPHGLCFGPDGNLYVGCTGDHSIRRYIASSGKYLDSFIPAGQRLLAPTFLAFTQQPIPVLAEPSLDFAEELVGSLSPARTLALVNEGTGALSIRSLELSGANPGDFIISNDGFSGAIVPSDGSAIVNVGFQPRGAGRRSAALSLVHNGESSPTLVPLRGIGTAPAMSIRPEKLEFGEQRLGTSSKPLMVTVTNSGTGPLTVHGVGLGGEHSAHFSVSNGATAATLAPGSSMVLRVSFEPKAAGRASARLLVSHSAQGSPHSLPLSGICTAPPISVNPESLTFDKQLVGTSSAAQMVTLTNRGSGPVSFGNATLQGEHAADFSISTDSCSGTTTPPGRACSIALSFSPSAPGERRAVLLVSERNGVAQPHRVLLAGLGTIPADLGISMEVEPEEAAPGAELTYRLTVRNDGPGTASHAVVTDALPANATFLSATTSRGSWSDSRESDPGTLTCLLGDLEEGAEAVLTVTVRVGARSGAPVISSASIGSGTPDTNITNNWARAAVPVTGRERSVRGRTRSAVRRRRR